MIYGYVSKDFNPIDMLKAEIEAYAKKNKISLESIVEDSDSNRTHWEQRELNQLVKKTAKPGDEIIVYEASNLARSSSQVLEIFEILTANNIKIRLLKYDVLFDAEAKTDTTKFIHMIQHIESDFVAKRTTEALARRRQKGLPLGRPKGRCNKTLKLDKDRKEIQKYLDLGISKASIAKLINCHAQTLYNYIEKRQLKAQMEQIEG